MTLSAPVGITPPAPGLDREEPDLWREDDIPSDDGAPGASSPRRSERDSPRESRSDERPLRKVERE